MSNYDIIILGSGPGGYVTAIRASQLGFKTAIVEKESLGGVCLNWGCIPTKALLKSAEVFEYLKHANDYGIKVSEYSHDFDAVVNRSRNVAEGMSKGVNFLMKKNKIEILKGYGKVKPGKVVDVDGVEYSAKHIIISTGARSRELPSIPQDGNKIIGYRQAMTLKKQPKSLIIVGSGAIGVEFAYFYNSMGTDVTIVEYLPNIVPVEDKDISKELEKSFKKNGIKVMTSSEVLSVDTSKKGVIARVKTSKGEEELNADILLSAVGIKTNIENIGLEDVGIAVDRDKILVNNYCETNIPGCTYCSPEISSVGLTEKQAIDNGYDIKVGKFPFSASGKASASGKKEGFVKVIFDSKYGEWLGCHMIGAGVTDMIAEAVLGRKLETTGQEVLKTIHPHPTMSEAVMEAVADAYDEVIHL